jgi:hypothetical protein
MGCICDETKEIFVETLYRKRADLGEIILENFELGSSIYTDEWAA